MYKGLVALLLENKLQVYSYIIRTKETPPVNANLHFGQVNAHLDLHRSARLLLSILADR